MLPFIPNGELRHKGKEFFRSISKFKQPFMVEENPRPIDVLLLNLRVL